MIEPLRLTVDVACPPSHAFEVWTERPSLWWPASHTASGEANARIVFEPFVGGRIYERTSAGVEISWGEIVAWEPPSRLGYLWHLRADRSDATDVSITFTPSGDGTRVEIEHRGWERLGDRGLARRERNMGGWRGVLPRFELQCATANTNERE